MKLSVAEKHRETVLKQKHCFIFLSLKWNNTTQIYWVAGPVSLLTS